ncbi:YdcF family protein [Moritella sp. Urea-trap-13]|uniref:YdcF family protein n=1 Tax=Moritella sp. Urea-trap-13 TaxID=2058327 RepID=UPI000C32974A|nr:YdcF family protein [Moritella sp. Urea-trap-13]PKH08141.1 YdcF family protein [Moritella sp. Urea-trap-13]
MSLLLISLLIIIFLVLRVFNCHRAKSVLLCCTVLLTLLISTGVIPKYLLDKLQQDYAQKPTIQWQDNNAIIVLGAGLEKVGDSIDNVDTINNIEPPFHAFGRIYEAAKLYNECIGTEQQCKIIVSGGDTHKLGTTEAAVYKQRLVQIGINTADIITEANSLNTWQNAQFTSAILSKGDFDNSVLVSSGLHIKRSQLYFEHFGVRATPIRADYMSATVSWLPLGYNFALTDFALHEWIGFIRYDIYNMLGANQKRVHAGDA